MTDPRDPGNDPFGAGDGSGGARGGAQHDPWSGAGERASSEFGEERGGQRPPETERVPERERIAERAGESERIDETEQAGEDQRAAESQRTAETERAAEAAARDTSAETDDELVEALFPEDDVDLPVKRQLTVRGVAIVGARVVTGVVGLGVAALAIGATSLLPLPSVRSEPASVVVTPVPTAQQVVCAGAVLRLSDETGQGATIPSPVGSGPTLDYAASAGEVDAVPLEQSDAGTGGTRDAPLLVSTPPGDPDARVLVSGAQVEQVNAGDYAGLAASGCAPAVAEAWFPSGATTVGRTTLLTLSNPTEVPATVDIELFDATGAVSAPGTSGIIVPPNGQRVLSVAGFAPDLESPVVHVTSTGGQVVANLQQSVVRGLDAGGVDIVAPAAAPATETVIPGVVISNVAGVQQLLGRGPDYADVAPVLRVFAPGEGDVEATLSVFAEDGAAVGTALSFDFAAGEATDVPLDGFEAPLQDGNYTVRVTTSVPAVAAVRTTSAATVAEAGALAPSDFAWFASVPTLSGQAQVSVADGPSPVLHLHNPTDAAVQVSVGDETVDVAAGASVTVAVSPGATLQLSGFESLAASLTVGAPGLLAGYPVSPPGAVSTPVVVYP